MVTIEKVMTSGEVIKNAVRKSVGSAPAKPTIEQLKLKYPGIECETVLEALDEYGLEPDASIVEKFRIVCNHNLGRNWSDSILLWLTECGYELKEKS